MTDPPWKDSRSLLVARPRQFVRWPKKASHKSRHIKRDEWATGGAYQLRRPRGGLYLVLLRKRWKPKNLRWGGPRSLKFSCMPVCKVLKTTAHGTPNVSPSPEQREKHLENGCGQRQTGTYRERCKEQTFSDGSPHPLSQSPRGILLMSPSLLHTNCVNNEAGCMRTWTASFCASNGTVVLHSTHSHSAYLVLKSYAFTPNP
jgi:hypothetical protein